MIVILCGESGSGKNAAFDYLMQNYKFNSIISFTTRPMREGESNGKEYNFISKSDFDEKLASGDIIESRSFNTLIKGIEDTWYYGSPKVDVKKNHLIILDPAGITFYKKFYGEQNCKVIYVTADNRVHRDRALARGSFDESEWKRRAITDKKDFKGMVNSADVVIRNNNHLRNFYKQLDNVVPTLKISISKRG